MRYSRGRNKHVRSRELIFERELLWQAVGSGTAAPDTELLSAGIRLSNLLGERVHGLGVDRPHAPRQQLYRLYSQAMEAAQHAETSGNLGAVSLRYAALEPSLDQLPGSAWAEGEL